MTAPLNLLNRQKVDGEARQPYARAVGPCSLLFFPFSSFFLFLPRRGCEEEGPFSLGAELGWTGLERIPVLSSMEDININLHATLYFALCLSVLNEDP